MSKERRPTLSEIAEQVRRDAAVRTAADDAVKRPGTVDRLGRLCTPDGTLLTLVGEISPGEAGRHVAAGARVAFEGCGCGGGGACRPTWNRADDVLATGEAGPRVVKGYGSPTWIDLWRSGDVEVVFAHGDIEWGDLLL